MSSTGHRDTEASLSPSSQENRESASGPKIKMAKKDSRSVGDLRDTTGHDSHNKFRYKKTFRVLETNALKILNLTQLQDG